MKALVGHVRYSSRSSYYQDWLEGFAQAPEFRATEVNLFSAAGRRRFAAAMSDAEIVVLLHSCLTDSLEYVRPLTEALKGRKARLIAFVGNEYNNPWAPLSDKIAWLKAVGADWVASQLVQASAEWLYEQTGARVISLPHALNPRAFPRGPATESRGLKIGTVSFAYPLFLGEDLRYRLFEAVAAAAARRGWPARISTSHRLDRAHWSAFLRDCRSTVASEAGAPLVERDDELALAIQHFVDERQGGVIYRPNNALRGLARRIPWPVKEAAYRVASRFGVRHEGLNFDPALYAEIHERFFAAREKTGVSGKCISARHFDAAGSGTAQILVEGFYNGILTANEHYMALDADLGNLEAVLDRADDPRECAVVAEAALAHALSAHTIAHRLSSLAAAVG